MKSGRMTLMVLVALALLGLVYLDYTSTGSGPAEAVRRPPSRSDGAAPVTPNSPVAQAGDRRAAEKRPAERAKGEHPLAGLALESLVETVERPLFEPTRQAFRPPPPPPPPPAPKVEPAKAAPPPPPPPPKVEPIKLRLVGVLASAAQSTAVVAKPSGQTLRVEEGDVIDGWEVRRIAPTEIELTRADQKVSIKLFEKRG